MSNSSRSKVGAAVKAKVIAVRMPGRLLSSGRSIIPAAALAALAGCSYVPDAINPVEWYRGTSDYIFGSERSPSQNLPQPQRQADGSATAPEGGSQSFPNLSTVPNRPAVQSGAVANSLVADQSAGGRYSSEAIPRQGEAVSPLRRELASPPPPPAVPSPTATAAAPPPSPPATSSVAALAPLAPPAPLPSPPPQQAVQLQPPPSIPRSAAPVQAPGGQTSGRSASVEETYRSFLAQRLPVQPEAPSGPPPANAVDPSIDRFETVFVSSSGVQLGTGNAPNRSMDAPAASVQRLAAVPVPTTAIGAPAPRAAVEVPDSIEAFLSRQPAGTGNSNKIATIVFEAGSARLSNQDRDILRSVAQLHRERGEAIRVVGHASHRTRTMPPIQHQQVNHKVSMDRANAVVAELTRLGVRRENVRIDARSDSEPMYYEVMPTGEAGNRRTEIYFVSN